jgi:ABC-type multidrug transport system fused ATPase/permease subunit
MQTLLQIARQIVTQGANRNPTYNTLNDYQRKQLTEVALQYRHMKMVNSIVIKEINEALDEAITSLAVMRQFYNDSYEAERMLRDDDAQRARDMNLAMRGY